MEFGVRDILSRLFACSTPSLYMPIVSAFLGSYFPGGNTWRALFHRPETRDADASFEGVGSLGNQRELMNALIGPHIIFLIWNGVGWDGCGRGSLRFRQAGGPIT